ncbi:leucyl/phenylalanyl-tRNA--protein transferase [Pseudomarimonas arenosa]|uniref:Leucyl/phenylalanyl-tRNA--protein transferase n=1 Tax=Pseudomarimonas arenosa TaxID=2774145 RepID=A0AAW3ZH64_9GAMM|nr:leucyl/phenylalanyl-tRNA--protein transferase [Pseudomarimonas arenosa]MBD8524457.1 leucyl/phenylalanyl-tRNA--protein transferase [Pseudomarimonas arenosa]
MIRLPQLGRDPNSPFPPIEMALDEPEGLLAFGGDLSPQRLINAYAQGIFPWYSEGQPLLWWSPDPRMLLNVAELKISRSLRRHLRQSEWLISINRDFEQVIDHCAELPRRGQNGTWITGDMQQAYCRLHDCGVAHSLEVWQGEQLVGGIYGIALGQFFFGESMFSRASNGSKTALTALCRAMRLKGMCWLDGQVESDHLTSLGFFPRPRADFVLALSHNPPTLVEFGPLDHAALQPAALAIWIPADSGDPAFPSPSLTR